MKTLVVVSGGDAPGINALLYRYAQLSDDSGAVGAVGGFPGVLNEDIIPLTWRGIAPLAEQAGSYLASSREPVLAAPDAEERLRAVMAAQQVDSILLLGGNGTLHHVLPLLVGWGIPCVGVPVTIDNDVPGTDYTLGFDSACNYAYQTVDGVRATMRALPGRVFMIETLGGDTGYLALAVARGACADAVLLPEYPYTLDWLAGRLQAVMRDNGQALIVLSEGAQHSRTLADEIPAMIGIRGRDVRLGHGQRGGKPTHHDRVFAVQAAELAYAALRRGVGGGVVISRAGRASLHEGTLTGETLPPPDRALYDRINGV